MRKKVTFLKLLDIAVKDKNSQILTRKNVDERKADALEPMCSLYIKLLIR